MHREELKMTRGYLKEKLESLDDLAIIEIWNDYCGNSSYQLEKVYDIDDYTIDSVFDNPSEVLKNLGAFDYNEEYFAIDEFGYINSFCGAFDTFSPIDVDLLIDWLKDNPDIAEEYGLAGDEE